MVPTTIPAKNSLTGVKSNIAEAFDHVITWFVVTAKTLPTYNITNIIIIAGVCCRSYMPNLKGVNVWFCRRSWQTFLKSKNLLCTWRAERCAMADNSEFSVVLCESVVLCLKCATLCAFFHDRICTYLIKHVRIFALMNPCVLYM